MKRASATDPSREWDTRTRRALPLLVLIATLAIASTACSRSPSASGTTATTAAPAGPSAAPDPATRQAALLRYAACIRSHGIPNFPDPNNGFLSLPQGIDPNALQAANQICQHLLPNGGSQQVTSPQNLAGQAKFAACMTKHGIPMSADGHGTLDFGNNIDPNSPQFQAAQQACQGLVPEGLP